MTSIRLAALLVLLAAVTPAIAGPYAAINNSTSVTRTSDGATIPADPGNTDWQAYQAWLSQGNTPDPAPAPTLAHTSTISSRQFYQQAAVQGLITQQEAIAVAAGQLPTELQALVAKLPAAQQFPATMLLLKADSFDINNPVSQALVSAFGWDTATAQAFWDAAGAL